MGRFLTGTVLGLALSLVGGWAFAEEHRGAEAEAAHGAEHGAEAAGGHGETHHPKPLDNWFSLSFGPGKEKQNGPFAFALFNFVVLVGLVVRYGRKPLAGYLRERHRTIRHDLEEAAALHREAQQKLELIDGKLRDLDREIADTKAAVAKDAEDEKQKIIRTAEAEAQRIVHQTEAILKRELRNAQRRLEVEAVESAIRAAEKLIRQKLTDDDRQRLNEDYYKQLAS